jgi:two-component system nitrate/nitrite response regulator NarL
MDALRMVATVADTKNQGTLRILIVDDHELVRAGVRAIISTNPFWEVCGEAENGRAAVQKVKELAPDLILLDISMPEMNGIEAAREIRRIAPATKIIIITMHESPQLELAARQAGADAVLTKRMASNSLITAVSDLFDVNASDSDGVTEDSRNDDLLLTE